MPGRRGLFVRKDATTGTSPQDARLALAGLVTPSGDLGVTPGVLSGCGVSGTTGWTYNVAAGHVVGTRGASDGASLFSVDGATATPAVAAAPASGSRWDLIWVRQRDTEAGDADATVEVGVTSGTSGGSPSKPYGSVPAGAVVLAEAQVSAGAAQTSDAGVTITQVATPVAARGGVISVPNAARLADLVTAVSPSPARPLIVRRQDTGLTQVHEGGSRWRRFADTTLGRAGYFATSTPSAIVVAGTPSWTTIATLTAETLGGVVELDARIALANGDSGALRTGSFRVAVDGTALTAPPGVDLTLPAVANVEHRSSGSMTWETTPAAGSHTFTLQANASSSGSVRAWTASLVVRERA